MAVKETRLKHILRQQKIILSLQKKSELVMACLQNLKSSITITSDVASVFNLVVSFGGLLAAF